MDSEFSLVKFCVMNFWATLINTRPFQPTSTLLIKLVEALINSEPELDKKNKDKIKWVYDHTHERVDTKLPLVELIVFRNLDKGINKEIEIGDNTFTLGELYNILDEISKDLSNVVIEIAKKYNLDMPIMSMSGSGNIQKISMGE